MARKHLLTLAALGLALTAGCVSQEKYNALKLDRDRYAEQLGQAQNEASAARSEAEAYKNQLAAIGQTGQGHQAMVLNLTNQNAELQRQVDDLNRRYTEAMNRTGPSPLPPALTNELSAFAQQNPDLVDFDAARGIVKFKSDVTFSPGSADLTPNAKQAIGRFAQILNSPAAGGYELMVAGHTDNTNVVNPATVQAGHKNNWYLSAHRAISVGAELQGQRINPQRIAVTGYADQRPIASNANEGGKAQNRRVEVLILPNQVRSSNVPMASTPPKAAPQAPARPKLNKDSATPAGGVIAPAVEQRNALNK
jgi:chemotaxis protein MotB